MSRSFALRSASPDLSLPASPSLRDMSVESDDDIEVIERSGSRESSSSRRRIPPSNSQVNHSDQSGSVPQPSPVQSSSQGLAPVNRALSFGEILPLSGRLHNSISSLAGTGRVVLELDQHSRWRLFEDMKKLEAQERKLEEAAIRAAQEADAQELAERKAEEKRIRAQKLSKLINKLGVWLKQVLILIGLIAVVCFVVETQWPGLGKQFPEIVQKWTQLLFHSGSAASEARAHGKVSQQMVVTSNNLLN